MKPLGSVVGVILATVIVLASGWSIRATTQGISTHRTGESMDVGDAHDRIYRVDSILLPDYDVAGNPAESSFGTVQPDGTYCGVFCSENH
jgi:hypothetical protein